MMRRSKTNCIDPNPERGRLFFRFLPFLLGVLLIQQCAHREPPPGGPVDRTPPQVVNHLPQSGATHLSPDQKITVTFSKTMEKLSVADALFISPAPKEPPRIKWKGREIKVTLAEGLQLDKTYVITLGVGCKDLRNNHMASSYSFAFCTGESVDRGSILGRVYQGISPRMGVDLWAYQLTDDFQPDPAIHAPDYITQTDEQGRFQLGYLGQGQYRLFAVEDLNDNRKFEVDDELLAIPNGDVFLSEDRLSVEMPPLRLAYLDTTGPSLKGIEVSHNSEVILYFDEPLDSAMAVSQACYGIISPAERFPALEIRTVGFTRGSRDRVTLSTAVQEEGRQYLISLSGLRDPAGNRLVQPGVEGEFLGNGLPDTTGPELISFWPPDSAQVISRDAIIFLAFSEAVEPISAETSFVLSDSAHGALTGQFRWSHGAAMAFAPDKGLESGRVYSVLIDAAGVRDLSGNDMQDTVLVTWFQTVEAERLGSISGEIQRPGIPDSVMAFIRAHELGEIGRENLVVTGQGEYNFADLLPGRYLLSAYLDMDGNSRFSFGCPMPFISAEPFWVGQDTVKVRSRWETAGVDIMLSR